MGNPKRFNVVVSPIMLKSWKRFAKVPYGGNVSHTVRAAMNELMNKSQRGETLQLRPILERLDEIKGQIEGLEEAMKEALNYIREQVDAICSINQVNTKRLLNAIIEVLEKADRPLFTEDVKERLPEYTIHEVRRGLEILKDNQFAVEQIRPPGEGRKTLWKLLGCKNATG